MKIQIFIISVHCNTQISILVSFNDYLIETYFQTDKTYEPIDCGLLSKVLSQEIKQRVKDLNLKR